MLSVFSKLEKLLDLSQAEIINCYLLQVSTVSEEESCESSQEKL